MTTATAPDWDPDQYRRFAAERAQPFHDLLDRLGTGPFDRAVDLGCGPGELTALAAERLSIGRITGIDSSLDDVGVRGRARLRAGDIRGV